MTLPGFLAVLQTGEPIIVREGGEEHVPAYALRHGRPDVRWSKPGILRKQLRSAIAFRKEGKKK